MDAPFPASVFGYAPQTPYDYDPENVFAKIIRGEIPNDTVYEDGGPGDLMVGINIEIKGRMQVDVLVADKVSFELYDD